jgi:hypothetical protein
LYSTVSSTRRYLCRNSVSPLQNAKLHFFLLLSIKLSWQNRKRTQRNAAKVQKQLKSSTREDIKSALWVRLEVYNLAFSLVWVSMVFLFLLSINEEREGFIRGLWTRCWFWCSLNDALRSLAVTLLVEGKPFLDFQWLFSKMLTNAYLELNVFVFFCKDGHFSKISESEHLYLFVIEQGWPMKQTLEILWEQLNLSNCIDDYI